MEDDVFLDTLIRDATRTWRLSNGVQIDPPRGAGSPRQYVETLSGFPAVEQKVKELALSPDQLIAAHAMMVLQSINPSALGELSSELEEPDRGLRVRFGSFAFRLTISQFLDKLIEEEY